MPCPRCREPAQTPVGLLESVEQFPPFFPDHLNLNTQLQSTAISICLRGVGRAQHATTRSPHDTFSVLKAERPENSVSQADLAEQPIRSDRSARPCRLALSLLQAVPMRDGKGSVTARCLLRYLSTDQPQPNRQDALMQDRHYSWRPRKSGLTGFLGARRQARIDTLHCSRATN